MTPDVDGLPDLTTYGTLNGLREAKDRAVSDGWVPLPYDTPEEGVVGWDVFKDGLRRRLEHALYGKKLRPFKVCTADVEEFRRLSGEHGGHDGYAPVTWPIMREIGFACPCGADDGTMTMVSIPLSLAKGSADLLRQALDAEGPWDERLSRSFPKPRACP